LKWLIILFFSPSSRRGIALYGVDEDSSFGLLNATRPVPQVLAAKPAEAAKRRTCGPEGFDVKEDLIARIAELCRSDSLYRQYALPSSLRLAAWHIVFIPSMISAGVARAEPSQSGKSARWAPVKPVFETPAP